MKALSLRQLPAMIIQAVQLLPRSLPWSYAVYPLLLGTCMTLFFGLWQRGYSPVVSTYAPILLGALILSLLEWRVPYRRNWQPTRHELGQDALYMLLVQVLQPRLLVLALSLLITVKPAAVWPHHWPLLVQVILMGLVADFFRYWFHRWSHEKLWLWRFHAIHHAPQKFYWFNVGVFHPLDKLLQLALDTVPFVLLGLRPEVLGAYFVFYGITGFFQHCNIPVKLGWLNYIIAGPELHRWHHSAKVRESSTNYGNKLILWDLVFGTFHWPQDRELGKIGIVGRAYPRTFLKQCLFPFRAYRWLTKADMFNGLQAILHQVLKLKIALIHWRIWRSIDKACEMPEAAQEKVLGRILTTHGQTVFGVKHDFARITSPAAYRQLVPVHDYEQLRPWIEAQAQGAKALTRDRPVLYAVSSGTTGLPKYIPMTKSAIAGYRKAQRLFTYFLYTTHHSIFRHRIVGIVSPSIEGYLPSGQPFGSVSGFISQKMPFLMRCKYTVPYDVSLIEDYETRYLVTLLFAMRDRNVGTFACANPSTMHKLHELMQDKAADIIKRIESGSLESLPMDASLRERLQKKLAPRPQRARVLRRILESQGSLRFEQVWPQFKHLVTWTGGSCGSSLESLRKKLPQDIRVAELGYLSSEFRGTVPLSQETSGLPTFWENYYEFIEKKDFDDDGLSYKGLHELELGKEYYIIVTTPAGLYRYHMNDIVRVDGFHKKTPLLTFIQKGRGVTNLTGEKLYEGQVISAVRKWEPRFFIMLADEQHSRYELYIESELMDPGSCEACEAIIDQDLAALNIEYQGKRRSGRLQPLKIIPLRAGAGEQVKAHYIAQGRREGQFKMMTIAYKQGFEIDFHDLLLKKDVSPC